MSLDVRLAELARSEAALRLRVGQALNVAQQRQWYTGLGFSTIGGYVRERCDRPARWGNENMRVARRLAKLPCLRAELEAGRVSWSMAALVARYATPDDETELAAIARVSTFRKMRAWLQMRASQAGVNGLGVVGLEAEHDDDPMDEERTYLTLSLTHEEAWALEAVRWLFDKMQPGASRDDFVNYVTGEGVTSLVELVPSRALAESQARADQKSDRARAWRDLLDARRDEAEKRAEPWLESALEIERARGGLGRTKCGQAERVWPCAVEQFASVMELDAHIRQLCHELASSDLLLGALAETFWKSGGWRRLGYASELQYARERLGLSPAAIRVKRALSRETKKLGAVAEAIERRRIGCYSALLVLRVASDRTVEAWLERAAERTFKMLREEVEAAELQARMSGQADQWPPTETDLGAIAKQREEVVSNAAEVDEAAPLAQQVRTLLRQMFARPTSRTLPSTTQPARRPGLLRYRFYVTRSTRDALKWFEDTVHGASPWFPAGTTPAQLLFATFLLVWRNELGKEIAYAHIYARDGHRCQNPFCDRRDVTPHHIVRRSQGGSDDDENVISLCTKCHLELLHRMRAIQADPPASNIRWLLGKVPIAVVEGRRKISLCAA